MTRIHYLLRELGARSKDLWQQPSGRILIVDPEGYAYRDCLAQSLPGCQFVLAACPDAARKLFLSSPADLVLLNHSDSLPCLDLLPSFKTLRPSVAVMVITGCGSEDLAVQAFRHGAIDYFKKPFAFEELELSIRAILEIRTKLRDSGSLPPVSGLRRALGYLSTNFHKRILLDDAAREAGMSTSCFERHLKKQTGLTFTAYLNSLRIAKAKELLQTGSTTVLQVALTCGFSNQSHFNRVFRKFAGVTPGDYRKSAPPN